MSGDLSRVEKIYIRTGYTDMRKQLDGLVDLIQYSFQLDPYSNSCSSSVENVRTGSRPSTMKETVSAFSINATKTAA